MTNLYPMELDEWQDRLYLESGDGVADIAVDVSECYDYDKGEWMEDELKKAAEEQAKHFFGANTVIIWE